MESNFEKKTRVVTYMRVGNIEQLEYYVKEDIENKVENIVGLYMRTNLQKGDDVNNDIYEQQRQLEKYCEDNKIHNKIFYIDVIKSGLSTNIKAFEQMITDIKDGVISKVIVTTPSKISRNAKQMIDFFDILENKDVEVLALDSGTINFDYSKNIIQDCKKIMQDIKEKASNDEIEY